ncbi:MAG TPA: putative Ig domain-containing protein [Capsulimonadaceae bacterium]|nr:putative Ig domain-containing protein [Capsulimonadaceae bacterium]
MKIKTHQLLAAIVAFLLIAQTLGMAAADTSAPAPDQSAPMIAMGPAPAPPKIHPPLVVGVHPLTPLLWTVPVSGLRPLSFSAKGLPRGLALNKTTGTITGKIRKTGDYAVHITVKNSAGGDDQVIHIVAGDKVALTPPMGWNSYDGFGDDVTEAEVLANARYVAQNMQPYGWNTVVVDFRWYDPGTPTQPNQPWNRPGVLLTMDQWGRLLPAPDKFPSAASGKGFKALADQIHAMGLQFGIHIMRGIPRNAVKANLSIEGANFHAADAADTTSTCSWNPDMYGVKGATPAGQAYYDSLFRLYASWGVDFVKVDDISRPYHTDEIDAIRKAIDKCRRSITLSLSPGATPLDQASHVEAHANMWREADDFWDDWRALDHEFSLGVSWSNSVGPGHWPDADMLPVGHVSIRNRSVGPDRQTHFTQNEQVTLLTLWALLPSPLMVGANLPDNDPWTLALLTNPEVFAVDQDSLGAASQTGDLEVWSRSLAGGDLAVGLFNRGRAASAVTARWSDLGINTPQNIRDLWAHKDLGVFTDQYQADIPGHGALFLRLTPAKK